MAEKATTRDIVKITESAVKKLLEGVAISQKGTLRRINGLLRQLEIKNGNIIPNQENIRLLRMIRPELKSIVVDNAYKKRVDTYLGNFDRIKSETDKLFNSTLAGFNPNKQVFKEVINSSISLTKTSLLETGIDQNVIGPVIDILNNGITTGANISEMEETLRTVIIGDSQRLGGLENTLLLFQYNKTWNHQ